MPLHLFTGCPGWARHSLVSTDRFFHPTSLADHFVAFWQQEVTNPLYMPLLSVHTYLLYS